MPETPNRGLPYPTFGDPGNVPSDIQNLAEELDDVLGQDTDWVDLVTESGVTGELRVRRTGDLVEVQFSGSGPFPEGATQLNSTNLATEFRPAGNRRGALGLSGSTDGSLGVSSSGAVFVIQATGASRAAADGSCLFHVG